MSIRQLHLQISALHWGITHRDSVACGRNTNLSTHAKLSALTFILLLATIFSSCPIQDIEKLINDTEQASPESESLTSVDSEQLSPESESLTSVDSEQLSPESESLTSVDPEQPSPESESLTSVDSEQPLLESKSTHYVDYRVHIFYYSWWGNADKVETDRKAYTNKNEHQYFHWEHNVIGATRWRGEQGEQDYFHGTGDDIGADYYPELGLYSSNDPATVKQHMEWIRRAGIGVLVVTVLGEGSFENSALNLLLDSAQEYGLKIAYHIEPQSHNNDYNKFKEVIEHLHEAGYIAHPATYKVDGKAFYYVYDSRTIGNIDNLLNPSHAETIRNTQYDGIFIGHSYGSNFDSNWDGLYNYWIVDGWKDPHTSPDQWANTVSEGREKGKIFIPCFGPGYQDKRIRPFNGGNTRERRAGAYYKWQFEGAIEGNPEYIAITSFNEWHEGTQIEPAIPKTIPTFNYYSYGDLGSLFYIDKTKEFVLKYKESKEQIGDRRQRLKTSGEEDSITIYPKEWWILQDAVITEDKAERFDALYSKGSSIRDSVSLRRDRGTIQHWGNEAMNDYLYLPYIVLKNDITHIYFALATDHSKNEQAQTYITITDPSGTVTVEEIPKPEKAGWAEYRKYELTLSSPLSADGTYKLKIHRANNNNAPYNIGDVILSTRKIGD